MPTSKGGRDPLRISVVGFSLHFNIELYMYEKGYQNDGFTHAIRKQIHGDPQNGEHEGFKNANFISFCDRRKPLSNNEIWMKPEGDYPRNVIIRWPDNDDESSTTKSRQEGLNTLKDFLMDPKFSKYPPRQIDLRDLTSDDLPASFDTYLLDNDIQEIMKMSFAEEELDGEFASKYPDVANMCWRSQNYGQFARDLGFGN